ncbi:MAG: single-stranded DNA-binding protein [Pseudomonadota bacterium]
MTQIVTLAGTTGKDAEFKTTQNGKELCAFSLAVNVGYGYNKTTYWWDVSRWGNGAKKLAEMMPKGTKVTVIGEVTTREHNGKTYLQCRADHVALQGGRQADAGDRRSDSGQRSGFGDQGSGFGGGGGFAGGFGQGSSDQLDDEVPF